MNRRLQLACVLFALGVGFPLGAHASEVIRLKAPVAEPTEAPAETVKVGEPKRAFDYDAFEARLESLWFQRKTLLSSGRDADADGQLEKIRAFCVEEGVKRLEALSGALLSEANRYTLEGSHDRALVLLRFAEAFDPGRPQIRVARARVYWKSGHGYGAAALELLGACHSALVRSAQDLSLPHKVAFLLGISLIASMGIFSLLMLARHQIPLRHEVEEWFGQFAGGGWPRVVGWAALGLPLLIWLGAGWAALYWLVLTFRFMSRGERLATAGIFLAGALVLPAYHVTVALYGMSTDPAVRTTLASLGGEYDPDRVVRLQQLVRTHPDDPVYRFLLAGLYKNGQYFEEAFAEYKELLGSYPDLAPVHVNIGNIFYITGQHAEAIANYRRAIELDPESFLGYFNMHLAQSEDFRFAAAEESLEAARRIDANRVARLLARTGGWGDRPSVQQASLGMTSVWDSALSGRRPLQLTEAADAASGTTWTSRAVNPISIISVLGLVACTSIAWVSRGSMSARRCIRCGKPFCQHCKSGKEAQEYCSQCMHLFVLGDGLAPGTKARKLYEVERHTRVGRRLRKIISLVLPGSAQLLRGRTGWGLLLLLLWCAALIASRSHVLPPLGRFAGINLRAELVAGSGDVPVLFSADPLAILGFLALPLVWCMGNAWRWRRRES